MRRSQVFPSVLDSTYNRNFHSAAGYGMTETTGIITHMVKGSRKYESVGGPVPNTEMKVVHLETRNSLAARQSGEICMRGLQV
jgi:4-coumarate--CoA ligase